MAQRRVRVAPHSVPGSADDPVPALITSTTGLVSSRRLLALAIDEHPDAATMIEVIACDFDAVCVHRCLKATTSGKHPCLNAPLGVGLCREALVLRRSVGGWLWPVGLWSNVAELRPGPQRVSRSRGWFSRTHSFIEWRSSCDLLMAGTSLAHRACPSWLLVQWRHRFSPLAQWAVLARPVNPWND
jgi:hypothetical protein